MSSAGVNTVLRDKLPRFVAATDNMIVRVEHSLKYGACPDL